MHPDADERHLPPRPQGRKCNDGPTAFAAPGDHHSGDGDAAVGLYPLLSLNRHVSLPKAEI